MNTPSKEAIEAAYERFCVEDRGTFKGSIVNALQDAYAIDFAALQQENERLRIALDLVSGALVDAKTIPVPDDVMKYGEAVRQLQQENERLKADVKDLIWSGCQTDQVAALVGEVGRQRTILRELVEALKGLLECNVSNDALADQARAALTRAEGALK